MQMKLGYLGRSGVVAAAWGLAMRFSPNLTREKVFFDQEVKNPLRFREAISALHDVVVGDLKFKKKDRTAWLEWKKDEARKEVELRQQLHRDAKARELERIAKEPLPPNLEIDFQKMHRIYWDARVRWANELSRDDPELFRHLVPCDPVVTVAPDVVYFECFSKDESSYGCLSVDRDAFSGAGEAGLGTTNVDYSLALFDHFQTLRTYRPTRLQVDPTGFEVKVEGSSDYREEKIDLPPSWLRGFGQLQAAMTLPTRSVILGPEAVYGMLAVLKRRREKTGPRCIRFLLTPGKPPEVVLDPWDIRIPSRSGPYGGERPEEIKVWGRRRLMPLARVLPLAERVEVRLLGSGLPSIWIAHAGELRFVLALSGWTSNDWTSGANLDLLAGAYRPDARIADQLYRYLLQNQRASLDVLAAEAGTSTSREVVIGSLQTLAKQGQVVYDFPAHAYRHRQVMPVALSESLLGPEHPELSDARRMVRGNEVKVQRDEVLSAGRRLVVGRAGDTACEAMFDADGGYAKAKCNCSHFYKNRLRAGPCRHLLALRLTVFAPAGGGVN